MCCVCVCGHYATILICTDAYTYIYVLTPIHMSTVIYIYTHICTHIDITLYTTKPRVHTVTYLFRGLNKGK